MFSNVVIIEMMLYVLETISNCFSECEFNHLFPQGFYGLRLWRMDKKVRFFSLLTRLFCFVCLNKSTSKFSPTVKLCCSLMYIFFTVPEAIKSENQLINSFIHSFIQSIQSYLIKRIVNQFI